MSTGNFANWDGDFLQIGPIYPFVGSEGLMVIIAVIFWVIWHILQVRAENRNLEDQARMLRQGNNLQKAVEAEQPVERF
jgi:heme exporter protein D